LTRLGCTKVPLPASGFGVDHCIFRDNLWQKPSSRQGFAQSAFFETDMIPKSSRVQLLRALYKGGAGTKSTPFVQQHLCWI
jgi:hypothetical protein